MTGGGDGVLTATLLFLAVGAIIGGATVTGAEWQHGTVVTISTWEVRRVRLLSARILSAMALATLIGMALLVLFCLSLVPTYLLRGTTDGADAEFWRELAFAIGRLAALTGLAAGLGAAVASIGRRTTVAIGASFAYLAVVETAVRAKWPERGALAPRREHRRARHRLGPRRRRVHAWRRHGRPDAVRVRGGAGRRRARALPPTRSGGYQLT